MPNSKLPSWAQAASGGAQGSRGNDPNLPSWAAATSTSAPQEGELPTFGTPIPKKKKGGGFFGSFRKVGHFVADKAGRAAHDIKAIPGGVVQLGVDEYKSVSKPVSLHDLVEEYKHPLRDKSPVAQDVKGQVQGAKEAVQHPLRDPFETLLTVAPVAHGLGRVADEGVALSRAARGKPYTRLTEQPRLLKSGDAQVPLHGSTNPAARAAQSIYDALLQHGLDKNPEGRVAAHAQKRIGGSISETQRIRQHVREVPANEVDITAKKLPRSVPKKVQQAALRLTSENATPKEAAAYHLRQADKGIAPEANIKQAKLYLKVHKAGLLRQDEAGNVHVDAERFPHLAKVDAKVAAGQRQVDQIAVKYGHRTPEALQTRIDAPNRYREGAKYVEPTSARKGVVSPALERQRADVVRLEKLHDRALDSANEEAHAVEVKNGTSTLGPHRAAIGKIVAGEGKAIAAKGSARADRLGAALSVAREKLDRMEQARLKRMEPTGIVGGEGARPGRGFVTYSTSEPRPGGQVASAPGTVIGKPKPFIRNKAFKAEGLAEGRVPDNTTKLVSDHMRQAYRYVNTDQFRAGVYDTGHDVKRSSREVLVADPHASQAPLAESDKIAAGSARATTDQIGEAAGYQAWLHDLIPGLRDNFETDKSHSVGTEAPPGYRWVDKGALGDLAKPVPGARNAFTRAVDDVNAAVTAATVYFKIGHVGTRVLTNAATTIIQGSAAPLELAKSVKLWRSLSETDRLRGMAAAGQKGFEALPAEGSSRAARVARVGAKWWAKHADAPFRFASIAYEARKAGFDTPAKFSYMLDKLENPHGLDAAQVAKIDWVAKRADRAGIAYDRLSAGEKRFVTRGVWFYPWVKGSTLFTGHTLVEHPYKSAVLGGASQQGQKRQASILGELPSYEQGLIPLGHGSHPTVTDFSTFSPFATGADVLDAATHPGQLSGFLNPAAGAGLQLITGTNQYGEKTNTPVTSALASLLSPTPEAQILTSYLNRKKDQSKRQFHNTPLSELLRSLGGPATPRRINKAAANKAAGLEKSGR